MRPIPAHRVRRRPNGLAGIGRVAAALAAAALATLALTALAPAVANAQAPLRLMSFNIRYGTANDGEHAWPHRRAAVAGTIADHAPHLAGLQEALRFQLDEIGAALGRYRVVGVGRDDGRSAGEHAAILVDTARLEILASGTFWLSDTPDVPGSSHWGNRITRITTWVRLADRATGDTLWCYNAHWDHESQASRERSALALLARIRQDVRPGELLLVMGDFNVGPANPAFRALTEASPRRLHDFHAAHAPPSGWGGTFHAFRGDRSGEKIDAILGGPEWQVEGAGIDLRRWGAVWASDHFAVWALVSRRTSSGLPGIGA